MKKYISPKTQIVLAMIIWGTLGVFVREIKLSSLEIAFFRAFLGSMFLLFISLLRRDKIDGVMLKKNIVVLTVSGLSLGINWITLFQAMKYTTISNAVLSYYFAPVFLVVFSAIFLKERVRIRNVGFLILAVLGLFLVMTGEDLETINKTENIIGISYGLIGAMIYASVVVLNKFIKGLSAFQSTLIQLLVSAIVLMPFVMKNMRQITLSINVKTTLLILILGIIHTGAAYLLYFSSIKYVKSKTIAILSYLDPIIAIMLSVLLLGETMNAIQVLGGVLILFSAYMSERRTS